MNPRPFPWSEAIGFGLGILRLSPDAFWRMTPRELACAMQVLNGARSPALTRHELEQMMASYPDDQFVR
jgi:uncharacterized phage protein (TIGR02216 family)